MTNINAQNSSCFSCEDTSGRQFTCNGCQKSFCWYCINDHQEHVKKQVDAVIQNYEHLKNNWNDDSHQNELFHQIDQWGKESIDNIRITANTARNDLKSSIKQSNNDYEIVFKKNFEQIDKSKELHNYSEIDLNQWTQQLNNIQSELQTAFNIQIKEDKEILPIYLIKIKQNSKRLLDQEEQTTIKKSKIEINNNEQFHKGLGDVLLLEQNLVAIHHTYIGVP